MNDNAAKIKIGQPVCNVSPNFFGLFFEDINFACDGGLNSNMINNHSFDGIYLEKGFDTQMTLAKKKPDFIADRLRYWEIEGGTLESLCDDPASESNPWYARITVSEKCKLSNKGYNGGMKNRGKCAMNILPEQEYEVSVYLRSPDYQGSISVFIEDQQGARLTESLPLHADTAWKIQKNTIKGIASGYGRFVLECKGTGSIDIDCIVFSNTDVWGKDDPKWSGGHFRKDLVESIADLKPKFIRFPGGCIVEGICLGNEYCWKDTIGPLIDRVPKPNLWATQVPDQGYTQSYQIGYYEYFLLCEDLGAEPLPIAWAGISCQIRSDESLKTNSSAFQEQVLQNALDMIEYANGDPAESHWAKLRAQAGHPKPFHMKMIGIGNENFDADYHEKFDLIKKAIQEKYPDMICVMSAGLSRHEEKMLSCWDMVREKYPDIYLDEHYYKNNEWFYEHTTRYDTYPRNTAKVFLGEYAANDIFTEHIPNTYSSALAEAAFLTGVERNSDVVGMISYAPLFCMAEGGQWNHNLIYFNPKSVLKTANYFVQQLFSVKTGTRVLATEGSVMHRAFINVTENNEKIFIKLVNANPEPNKITLELPVNQGTAVITAIAHEGLESVNELDFTSEPVYHVYPVTSDTTFSDSMLLYEMDAQSFCVIEIAK